MTDNQHREKEQKTELSSTTVKECVKSEGYNMARIMWWKETRLHHAYVSYRVGPWP